ncbi:hypothetical protein UN90_21595 [Escherichia coli]|nr:hypothetical protein BX49_10565 [Escherichia coli O145:NM str. 2010C-3518]EYV32778.1 hypothetical protein BX48_13640 [Escherichia coli O145:NM str. 2010C-3517]EYZ68255.1 hypothetical protein BW85_01865 [Escherichia coli O69:H11 str. 06-3325]KDM71374.1 hypothetical protein DC23_25935 [Escherichia coli O145:H28 str. 4865/96]KDM77600.1 hypothetical protein DC24_20730 [Escherichia coli]
MLKSLLFSDNTKFKKGNSGKYGIIIEKIRFIFSHLNGIFRKLPVTEQNTNIKTTFRRINVW